MNVFTFGWKCENQNWSMNFVPQYSIIVQSEHCIYWIHWLTVFIGYTDWLFLLDTLIDCFYWIHWLTVFIGYTDWLFLLAHLTQRVRWAIAITWRPSSSSPSSVVSFSHFNLLLRNHWAKWNQTWQECTSGGPL